MKQDDWMILSGGTSYRSTNPVPFRHRPEAWNTRYDRVFHPHRFSVVSSRGHLEDLTDKEKPRPLFIPEDFT
jgi:hypothetical protein